jgi:thiamine biosynthesis lipoprotein
MSRGIESRRARPLLGTFVEIAARAPNESIVRPAIAVGFVTIARVQQLMNRHDPASEVGRLNRDALRRPVEVHPWTRAVLQAAREFAEQSDGAFDVTLGTSGSWRDVAIEDDGRVRFRRAVEIDLGGIAKGFAVDRAVEALKKAGALSGVVNAGGDLRVFGEEARVVHIRHPLAPGFSAGTICLCERALATSGQYFSPALCDGRTGAPILEEMSVTIGAPDCMTADALTKIVLALREESRPLLDRYAADAFLLEGDLPPRWLSRHDAHQFDQA